MTADEYSDLVLVAYTGEVVGEAVFGGIAMLLVDPEHRAKLEVLRLLEDQTEAVLRPLAERCGITDERVVSSRRNGWSYALMAADEDARWAQVVDGLVQGCPGIIARFERLPVHAPPRPTPGWPMTWLPTRWRCSSSRSSRRRAPTRRSNRSWYG